jgi:hypothetical protein
MKFKIPVSLNILSPQSLFTPADFLDAVRTYCDLLPNVLPEKWGWDEPDRVFDLQNFQALIPDRIDKMKVQQSIPAQMRDIASVDRERCETVNWERKKKPKAEGGFAVRWCSKSPKVHDTHANIHFAVELDEVEQNALVNYLKKSSVRLHADLALLDVHTPSYSEFARISGSAKYSDRIYVVTHSLRHWLPDVFWGTVFGPPYIALFGKEKLLSAPVAVAEQISGDMIYIQLTDGLVDVASDPVGMTQRRKAFKDHLGVDAFFEEGRGYDSFDQLDHGPFGDVFVTPKFELVS